jgi:hypothetical protein
VIGDSHGSLHFVNRHGILLFSQQVFKSTKSTKTKTKTNSKEEDIIGVKAVSFVGDVTASNFNTLAVVSSSRLLVLSRLDLIAFEKAALAKNDKEVTKIRRMARISQKDVTKHHSHHSVAGMVASSDGQQPRIYVYGHQGDDLLTAWTLSRKTRLQLRLVGRVDRQNENEKDEEEVEEEEEEEEDGGNDETRKQRSSIMSLHVLSGESQIVVGMVRQVRASTVSNASNASSSSRIQCWDASDLSPIDLTFQEINNEDQSETKEHPEAPETEQEVEEMFGIVALQSNQIAVVSSLRKGSRQGSSQGSSQGNLGMLVNLLKVDVKNGSLTSVQRTKTPPLKSDLPLLCSTHSNSGRAWCVSTSGLVCLSLTKEGPKMTKMATKKISSSSSEEEEEDEDNNGGDGIAETKCETKKEEKEHLSHKEDEKDDDENDKDEDQDDAVITYTYEDLLLLCQSKDERSMLTVTHTIMSSNSYDWKQTSLLLTNAYEKLNRSKLVSKLVSSKDREEEEEEEEEAEAARSMLTKLKQTMHKLRTFLLLYPDYTTAAHQLLHHHHLRRSLRR